MSVKRKQDWEKDRGAPVVLVVYQLDHHAPGAKAHLALIEHFVRRARAAGVIVKLVRDLPKQMEKTFRQRFIEAVRGSGYCVAFIFPDARSASRAGNLWYEVGSWDGRRGATRLLVVNATGEPLGPSDLHGHGSLESRDPAKILSELQRIIAENPGPDLAEVMNALKLLGYLARGAVVAFVKRELSAMHGHIEDAIQDRTFEYKQKATIALALARAADAAQLTIQGINTYAADCWFGPMAPYYEANRRAMERNVKVRRVFVLNDLDEEVVRGILLTAERHRKDGVEVHFAFQGDLERTDLYSERPLISCALFDGDLLGYELHMSDRERRCPDSIRLTWDPASIQELSPFPAIYDHVCDEKEVRRRLRSLRRGR
jgi:hypothetical protein